jgi:hypothetical protein
MNSGLRGAVGSVTTATTFTMLIAMDSAAVNRSGTQP